MPAREPSLRVDGRCPDGDLSPRQRLNREAMVGNTSPQGSRPRADGQLPRFDDAEWDHDEAARRQARRLLSRSHSRFYSFSDRVGSLRRRLAGERWVRRLAIAAASLFVMFGGCFGALWWRLGAGQALRVGWRA